MWPSCGMWWLVELRKLVSWCFEPSQPMIWVWLQHSNTCHFVSFYHGKDRHRWTYAITYFEGFLRIRPPFALFYALARGLYMVTVLRAFRTKRYLWRSDWVKLWLEITLYKDAYYYYYCYWVRVKSSTLYHYLGSLKGVFLFFYHCVVLFFFFHSFFKKKEKFLTFGGVSWTERWSNYNVITGNQMNE